MGNLTVKESGEMVNFISPNVSKITSFKVHFSPKQEGTGDPSPENVREITGWNGVEGYGCGKNLVPWIKTNFTVQGNYYNGFAGWSKLWEIPKRISYTYSVFIDNSNCNTAGGARVWLRDIDNSKYTHVVTGTTIKAGEKGISTVTLNFSNLPNDYYACWGLDLHPNAIASMPIVYESNQEKQITSDWSKNLLDTNHEIFTYTGCQRNSDGSITLNSSNGKSWTDDSNFPPLELKKGTYTISWYGITEEDSAMINLRTSVDEYVNNIRFANGNGTFTLNEDCGVKFKISASTYPVSGYIQIENGSEPTEYQPYVGTIYGGYVDLISGELVQDIRYKQITADELSNAGNSIGYTSSVTALGGQSAVWIRNLFNSTAKGRKSGGIKANCNAFKVLMNSTGVSSSQNRTAFAVDSETITSVADFISAVETLEQNDNGLYLAYELAEPITHQLTPQQLSTLKGQNNFWSNADYVEIEYELTETFDIQKAKRKIILNQPHVESVSGDLVTFDTDMKGKLKECKVYFSPVQEGEGDPSPDNVRNITGWNGVRVGLPDEYQEVEWIQSTERKQFILLPYGFEETDTVTITASIGTEYSKDKFIIAPREWNNNNNRFAMVGVFKDMYCIGYGNHPTNYTCLEPTTNNDGNMHTWTFANKVFKITDLGLSIDVSNITFGGVTSNLKLFYGYNQNINGKLSYYKHVKLNGEVYEFIPCYRKSDGEIGLYDIKNHVFYTNDGTGSFLKGKDVNNITTNINWTDNIGTVYGGYVDLVSGELVVDRAMTSYDGATLYKDNGTYKLWMVKKLPYSVNIYGGRAICNITKSFGYVPSTALETKIQFPYGTNSILFASIPADFNIADVQAVYELAEPIRYQLTPQQILTLKGINNVYSDTNGQMEIKYWKH